MFYRRVVESGDGQGNRVLRINRASKTEITSWVGAWRAMPRRCHALDGAAHRPEEMGEFAQPIERLFRIKEWIIAVRIDHKD